MGCADASVHLDDELQPLSFTGCIEYTYFFQHITHETLTAESGYNTHHKHHVQLTEVGQHLLHRGRRIYGETGMRSTRVNGRQCGAQIHMPLALYMNGNHVHAGLQETREIMIRRINHKVGVQVSLFRYTVANGCADIRPEGDIVYKGAIHHIEVKPVCSGSEGAGGFFSDTAEIAG